MTSPPLTHSGRRAIYTGRTTSWPMVAGTFVGALLLVLLGLEGDGSWSDVRFVAPLVVIAVGVLGNVLTASSVRATAGPNGFTVRWGLIGWPRCTYPLDQIASAEVVDLPWWRVSWGFWWTPSRTSCTVRRGPTVRLSLRNGRIATITVPDPAAAVAAVREASTPT